eukprot:1911105-Pyramimonas_sp.AAC.1
MNTVRVFYSLLILSLLEAFLWSIPYCADTASARDFYARETVRHVHSSLLRQHAFHRSVGAFGDAASPF